MSRKAFFLSIYSKFFFFYFPRNIKTNLLTHPALEGGCINVIQSNVKPPIIKTTLDFFSLWAAVL